MTERQKLYAGASALVIAGAAWFYVKRSQAVAEALASGPTVFTPNQWAPPIEDFPPGTAVTWFQGQMTPKPLPNLASGTSPSYQNYIPLFGFIPGLGFGLPGPDGFA